MASQYLCYNFLLFLVHNIFVPKNKKGIYADNIISHGVESISCDIHTEKGIFKAMIPIPGEHMVNNVLAATAVALELGLIWVLLL